MREFYAEAHLCLDLAWAENAFSHVLQHSELGCVWLAERDNIAAGHIVLTLRYTMEHGALTGYIDDLFVRPEFRRQRIAHALVSELVRESKRLRCRSVCVEVGDHDAPAIGLYRGLGLEPFQEGRLLLHRALCTADDSD